MELARRVLAQIVQRRGDAAGQEHTTYALRLPQAHLGTDLNDSRERNEDTTGIDDTLDI